MACLAPTRWCSFPEGERRTRRHRRERKAKRICARRPVQQACLQRALTAEEPYGAWD
ncbi:WhiB family transcriptional regulator [Halosaccharopolyspora lacisalsi]|uniref:WhiB family transcriptional regulator n=1 Tax=Halosaccharopolyspora lacisalsi TaxID=1000566 RepID=UPI0015F81EA4